MKKTMPKVIAIASQSILRNRGGTRTGVGGTTTTAGFCGFCGPGPLSRSGFLELAIRDKLPKNGHHTKANLYMASAKKIQTRQPGRTRAQRAQIASLFPPGENVPPSYGYFCPPGRNSAAPANTKTVNNFSGVR